MNKICVVLSILIVALPSSTLLPAQAGTAPTSAASTQRGGDRARDLNRLFNDIWQDKLKHDPEYATDLGDKRYDDQLTDTSPRAVNDALARGRAFIERL